MSVTKLLFTWNILVWSLFTLAGATPVAKNTREFKVLCRLLKIAEEGAIRLDPEGQARKMVHLAEAEKLADDFSRLETKLSENANFPLNFTDSVNEENYTITEPAKVEMLRRIEASRPVSEQLRRKMEIKKDEVKKEYERARGNFKAAIVGEELENLPNYNTKFKLRGLKDRKATGATEATRDNVCTADQSKEGSEGGYTIRTDLMCICASGHAHTQKICGFDAGGSSSFWESSNNDDESSLGAIWANIYKQCEASKLEPSIDPTNIGNALTQFDTLLGAAARDVTNLRMVPTYIFGWMHSGANSGTTCDGAALSSDGDGACVNYAGQGGKQANITWREKMIEAQEAIQDAQEKAQAAVPLLRRLESLHHNVMNAAMAPDSKIASNPNSMTPSLTGNKTQKEGQYPTTPGAHTIAQDEDALKAATIAHFILLWVLQ